jgi:putative Holliday junction resolvase
VNALHRLRIAGVDYGTVRIGVATADLDVGIATPRETYARRTPTLDADYFRRLCAEERIGRWVVGLPVRADGGDTAKSLEARRFGAWLQATTGVAVEFFDERYTSFEAEQALQAAKLSKKKRKQRIDRLAAQILLTAYLEAGARNAAEPPPLED